VWTAKQDTNWRATLFSIRDAVWALVVKDLITAEEFKILCEPWVSVMDKQVDEQQQVPVANETPTTEAQPNSDGDDVAANLRKEVAYRDATIQGLIAALEIKNQQLATAERKSRRWKERAEKAKAKLAKFHPCYDSNGCYGELDSVHIVDADGDSFTDNYGGERMRTVWHKDGE
jgi:hypothetical protein